MAKMHLKVYTWQGHRRECPTHHRQTREIVAATSKKAAAAAVGETPGRLFNLHETRHEGSVTKAMSQPGVVFWQSLDLHGAAADAWTTVIPKEPKP
jgi:hypothetical protein